MLNTSSNTVFEVSPVKPAEHPLREIVPEVALKNLLGLNSSDSSIPSSKRKLEACSVDKKLVREVTSHPLVAAVHLAFDTHRPLSLSPDMIWLLIAQGLANHINLNAESLRPLFVKHQDKLTLQVRRDEFVKGSDQNAWPEVFSEFSKQIRQHIGENTHDLLMPNFSTTGFVEKAAAEIVLMEAMLPYFEYELQSFCGIPKIRLEGTLEDWQALLKRTKSLAQFGLVSWINVLVPILEQFIQAIKGQPNSYFWQSLYKIESMSGGNQISGWIIAFFPYLKPSEGEPATKTNPALPAIRDMLSHVLFLTDDADFSKEEELEDDDYSGYDDGIWASELPLGLSVAPFRWNYLDRTTSKVVSYEMEFLGGFVGVTQDSELFLRPEIGWAVCEVGSNHNQAVQVNSDVNTNENPTANWLSSVRRRLFH